MKAGKSKANREQGFTLIELLIAIAVGLIVVAAIISMFVAMLRANSENLKYVQLNQDLRAAMVLMTRDIRRAGAMQNAAENSGSPFDNVFIGPNEQGVEDACISYSYEIAVLETERFFGFRWNSDDGTVEDFRGTAPADCAASGWAALSDPALVNVTRLDFQEDFVEEAPFTIMQVWVDLTGALRNDANVTRRITETVKIRNEAF